jgi:hypothetical protein
MNNLTMLLWSQSINLKPIHRHRKYNGTTESSAEENSKYLGHTEPLSEADIQRALRIGRRRNRRSKDLLRNAYTGDIRTSRHYSHTLDAILPALDRLGADRETVVVELLRRFEPTVPITTTK